MSESTALSPSAEYLAKQPKTRAAVVPPRKVSKNMNVFEYLERCTPALHRKIADIACSQTKVPPELRDDAVQEIYMRWTNMKPDTRKYRPGQVAAYAHHMARHAALHLRREIGSATCLPGSAFRKRRDGSSYVTPGVLATPVDWNELEAWFQTDGGESGTNPFGAEAGADLSLFESESDAAEASEEEQHKARLASLEAVKSQMSERQYQIALRLTEGESFAEIMAHVGVKKGVLMRELATVSSLLNDD